MAKIRDGMNYMSKLTIPRLANAVIVYFSFYLSRISGRSFHPASPLSISIEPTTACNLGCPECPSGLKMFTRETGNLREAEMDDWLNEMGSRITYVNFYFQGEPFIHPGFLELIKKAVALKLYTSTSTNGHFLHDDMARKTVESGLDRLIISIDGVTQEVYEKYRIHGKLDKVIEGTKNIVKWKKQLKSSTPYVIFQFLVVKPNEHQIGMVKTLAKELGVDEVKYKTAQVYDYENGNELIPLNEKFSRYKSNGDGTYSIKNKLEDHCWRMWSSCVITWDGNVVPCCFDKDATHELGSLRNQSFKEIWNGQNYRSFRKKLLTGRKNIDICANCSEGTEVWTAHD